MESPFFLFLAGIFLQKNLMASRRFECGAAPFERGSRNTLHLLRGTSPSGVCWHLMRRRTQKRGLEFERKIDSTYLRCHIYRFGDESRLATQQSLAGYKLFTCNTPRVFTTRNEEDKAALLRLILG